MRSASEPAPLSRRAQGNLALGGGRLKFVLALFAVSMAAVLSGIDQTVVSTALPHIIASLQGADILGWVFTAYFLGATATVMVTGKLADLFGRKRVFLLSVAIFCVGSVLCGLANNMLLLVAFRGLQGIGAGSIQTCSLVLMGDMFSPRDRGKWQGIQSVGFATASAIGPSVGGLLSDNFSWRWIFLVNVPICLLTFGALVYGLPSASKERSRPEIDWAGGGWSMATVISLLLALTWGGRQYAWTSPEIAALAVATACFGLLLWRAETRAAEPIISGSLLKSRATALSGLAACCNSMVWFGLILLSPLRLQLVLGSTATAAGAVLTPGIVLSPISAIVAGQLVSRIGRYRTLSILAGVLEVTGVCMMLFSPAGSGPLWVSLSFAVTGMGTGFGAVTFLVAFQNAIPSSRQGAGMGLFSLFRQFGSSVGTAVAGSIAGSTAALASSALMSQAIQRAVLVQLGAALVVVFCALLSANVTLRAHVGEVESVLEARALEV